MDKAATPAKLEVLLGDNSLVSVKLTGDWGYQSSLPDTVEVEAALAGGQVKALEFSTSGLGRWNSRLLVTVLRCREICKRHQVEFRIHTLPPGMARLVELSQAVPEKKDAARDNTPPPWLRRVGESAIQIWSGSLGFLTFLGESVVALGRLLRGTAQFRRADLFMAIQECGPQSLGIVLLINFLMGLILAFVGATVLAKFGASVYNANLVAIATVREMGCIMTGIILCGRTGAAFAAQLGTMKVNQEIEAFQTFGISTVEFLVLPRLTAMILLTPLLCVFADFISIAGGFMVSTFMLHITPQLYLSRTIQAISLNAFLLGVFKGAFFGVIVALTGCLRGMQCGNNAAAVGQATTSAVVTGITAIIAADGVFAVLCNVLKI
jgi:phospholipid/cholesterol/gamma-HCH transport system permease protein